MPKLSDVFGLYTKMLLGLGIVFQMPTVVFFLAKMQMVTARFLVKQVQVRGAHHLRRSPPSSRPTGDPMNQMIFAAPMIALYGLSIAIAWIVGPRGRSRATGNGHGS